MSAQHGPGSAQAFFLDTPSGRVFALHHRPGGHAASRGQVLLVAPFNEEMNRCRSMMTLQAQALARLGYGTLLIDLYGTGDSEGDYSDARWERWLWDLRAAHEWLAQQPGTTRVVMGIRLGAILACDFARRYAAPATPLVLWQPVMDGKMHLTQFLRVRMAAQLDRPHLPKESTASMREQFAAGNTLEVAGYEIHPELASAIDGARLSDHAPMAGTPVALLESAAEGASELSPASRKLLADWTAAGIHIEALAFTGPAFWQVHERVTAPAIIEQTCAWLQRIEAPS